MLIIKKKGCFVTIQNHFYEATKFCVENHVAHPKNLCYNEFK